MKIRRTLMAMALLAVASVAFADTMLVKKIHQDAMPLMNQPATESTQTTWIGSGRLRIDGGENSELRALRRTIAVIRDADACQQ